MIRVSEKTIVIELDGKRAIVLVLVLAIGVFSLYGYITALFAFIAPSEEFPLDIVYLSTFDIGDNEIGAFPRGDTVRIKANVEMATDYYYNYPTSYYYYYFDSGTTYKIIFAVTDSEGRPVFFNSADESVSPGGFEMTSFDYTMSSQAPKGTYNMRVMVWSDWLPQGVALYEYVAVGTFEVT